MNIRFVILSFILSMVRCAPNDEVAAELFINQSSDKLYDIIDEIDYTIFLESFSDNEALESYEKRADPEIKRLYNESIIDLNEFHSRYLNYSVQAGEFKYNKFKNSSLKQGIQKIHLQFAFATFLEDVDNLIENLRSVLGLEVCHFTEKLRCDVDFLEIKQIVQESNCPKELRYYWKEWRYVNQPLMKENLKLLVRYIQKISEHWNVSPLTLFFSEVFDESVIDDMQKVLKEIEPMYAEIHAFVRSYLIEIYNSKEIIHGNGLIPAHLFEKVLEDFAAENEMWKTLNQSDLTPNDVLKFSNDFFIDLGFHELPKVFWEGRINQLKSDDCEPLAIDLAPKSYLTYCDKVDMKTFLETHHQMAKIYTADQKKHLSFAYFSSMTLKDAIGFATRLATMTSNHMNSLGLINGTDYASKGVEKNRIKLLGISSILNIPIHYVHTKVVADLITGTIDFDKINTHYWELMKTHAGVSPPISVEEDDVNFPYDFYYNIFLNKPMINFMSEVIGHQIYESLCKISKHDDIELHRCDFSKSLEAGKVLKEMMSTGCKKPWREVLSIVTGNKDGMSGTSIMKYYSSLYNWIQQQNTNSAINLDGIEQNELFN